MHAEESNVHVIHPDAPKAPATDPLEEIENDDDLPIGSKPEKPKAEESKPRRRRARPRADKVAKEPAEAEATEEEEVPINLKPIKRAKKELMALCTKAIEAGDAYKEAVVAASKRAGLRHVVVKAYINACVMDKYDDMQQKAEQLSLLFTEI